MKKNFILLIVFSVVFDVAIAQIKPPYKNAGTSVLESARRLLNKEVYNIADDFEKANKNLAEKNKLGYSYDILKKANSNINKLKESKKEHLKKRHKITPDVIAAKQKAIIDSLIAQAKRSNSLEMLTTFDASISESEAKQIETAKYEIAFALASKENTYKAYEKFIKDYPNAIQVKDAKQKFKECWIAIYRKATQSGEDKAIVEFKKAYPDFPYPEMITNDSTNFTMANMLQLEEGYKKEHSELYHKFIMANAPNDLAFVVLQRLIEPHLKNNQPSMALQVIEKYEANFAGQPLYSDLKNLLQNASSFKTKTPVSLGTDLNSKLNESYPVMFENEQSIYFSRQIEEDGKTLYKVYKSLANGNKWQKPVCIDELNLKGKSLSPLSITPKGHYMFLFNSDNNGDIYVSTFDGKKWGTPFSLKEINTEYTENYASVTYFEDGLALIFASDRRNPSGLFVTNQSGYHGDRHGNMDLYISFLKPDKGWTAPVNLGLNINTPYAELSPYLHDDKTLYFSSDGHAGFGKADMFKTTRSDSTWTKWTKPENIGSDFNTTGTDYGYTLSKSGNFAYFSKSATGSGLDMFCAFIPDNKQPNTLIDIQDAAREYLNNQLTTLSAAYEDSKNHIIETYSIYSKIDSVMYVILKKNTQYASYINKEGYLPIAKIVTTDSKYQTNVKDTLYAVKIQDIIDKSLSIPMKNIYFGESDTTLQISSNWQLDRIAEIIKKYPDLIYTISGHTDNVGDEASNQKFSEGRANAVCRYFVNKGCNPKQVKAVGYGSKQPKNDNSTNEKRAENRRVEIKISKI